MIPVKAADEPPGFDQDVRKPGEKWLEKKQIPLDGPMPAKAVPPAHWQKYTRQLWEGYHGTCAYLAIFFEWPTGAASTDHFIPKTREAEGIYDWKNYRLACLAVNRDKGVHDVLDPIGLKPETFHINFASGKISANKSLTTSEKKLAKKTITDLGLDEADTREMRARHYQYYLTGEASLSLLKKLSPFVYFEIVRQGLDAKDGDGTNEAVC